MFRSLTGLSPAAFQEWLAQVEPAWLAAQRQRSNRFLVAIWSQPTGGIAVAPGV